MTPEKVDEVIAEWEKYVAACEKEAGHVIRQPLELHNLLTVLKEMRDKECRCETCGSHQLIDDCPICGAPVCCQPCCTNTALSMQNKKLEQENADLKAKLKNLKCPHCCWVCEVDNGSCLNCGKERNESNV